MKILWISAFIALMWCSVSYGAMTLEAVQTAAENRTLVYYAPDYVYDYINWDRPDLPNAPFTHTTNVPHGTIDQMTNVKSPPAFEDEWIITVNGSGFPLSRLFGSLALFKTALQGALTAKATEAAAKATEATTYAASVDEIGTPVLVVSPTELDFGETESSLTFDITNSGNAKLHWTITTTLPTKVTFNVSSGDTLAETDTITVTVSRNGVSPGTYYPTVSVSSDGGEAEITLTVVVP